MSENKSEPKESAAKKERKNVAFAAAAAEERMVLGLFSRFIILVLRFH